ncbi:hypothetical protein PR003_g35102 [Phytophthora rubi]|nr:hypothetical protein PR003_g35102 [Phytophthora rubi]
MAEDTAPQLGECSGQLRASRPTTASTRPWRRGRCVLKLNCVQGANMTATEPALICHTYMSCIAQIVAAGKQLAGVNCFCSAICPQEMLGTVT